MPRAKTTKAKTPNVKWQDDGEGVCPYCGSTTCFTGTIPGPLLCRNTGKVVLAENEQ